MGSAPLFAMKIYLSFYLWEYFLSDFSEKFLVSFNISTYLFTDHFWYAARATEISRQVEALFFPPVVVAQSRSVSRLGHSCEGDLVRTSRACFFDTMPPLPHPLPPPFARTTSIRRHALSGSSSLRLLLKVILRTFHSESMLTELFSYTYRSIGKLVNASFEIRMVFFFLLANTFGRRDCVKAAWKILTNEKGYSIKILFVSLEE